MRAKNNTSGYFTVVSGVTVFLKTVFQLLRFMSLDYCIFSLVETIRDLNMKLERRLERSFFSIFFLLSIRLDKNITNSLIYCKIDDPLKTGIHFRAEWPSLIK